jgi:lactoylglutathione lyase
MGETRIAINAGAYLLVLIPLPENRASQRLFATYTSADDDSTRHRQSTISRLRSGRISGNLPQVLRLNRVSVTKMRYLHSMIRVHDLDAAMDFFCNKLGLVETRRAEYPEGRFTLVYLAAQNDLASARSEGSAEVELTYNWDTRDYPGGSNFGHLAFEVDDIYQLCQQLIESGITINRPPRDGRMAFVRSPDNISIELLQRGPALEIREPWASMKNTGEW